MLDAAKLGLGEVAILGVFTDFHQTEALGFGECASKVMKLLNGMPR
jgi:hypothetical protein